MKAADNGNRNIVSILIEEKLAKIELWSKENGKKGIKTLGYNRIVNRAVVEEKLGSEII